MRNKTKKNTTARHGKAKGRSGEQLSAHDLMRQPDITAAATMRFTCRLFLKVSNPEYLPHEVMALVRQGQAQLDPIAPGQVGTLILNGFPYTVLGYYTFMEQDVEYDEAPKECSFHGPFYDFYRQKNAAIQEMASAVGEGFDEARQVTREMREHMAKVVARRQKRRERNQNAPKT